MDEDKARGGVAPNPVAFSNKGPRKGEQASGFGASTPNSWNYPNSWSHNPMANLIHPVASNKILLETHF